MDRVLLFDGECNFCDGAVNFVIKRDREGYFKFASLQSEVGQMLLRKYHISPTENSFILIDRGTYYSKSTAALHVCKKLDGLWKLLFPLIIVPRPIRNFVYNMIANNRYKWFGKKDSCTVPPPHIRKRFL